MSPRSKAARTLRVAVLLALVVAAPAGAATWSAPSDLSTSGAENQIPQVALDGAGNAQSMWLRNPNLQMASAASGAAWAAIAGPLNATGTNQKIAVNAAGDAVAVWETPQQNAQVATRPAGSSWSAPQDLSILNSLPGSVGMPSVAIDAAGDAVTAWNSRVCPSPYFPLGGSCGVPNCGFGNGLGGGGLGGGGINFCPVVPPLDLVLVATHPAGGAWSVLTPMMASGVTSPDVAMNAAGDAVVAYQSTANDAVFATTRLVAGPWADATFDTPTQVTPNGATVTGPQVGITNGRETIATWLRSGNPSNVAQAAVRPAGGAWSAPATLSQTGQNAEAPQLATDTAGDAVAVWRRTDGTNYRIQAATRAAGGSWSATPDDLSAAGQDASGPTVAMSPNGFAIAAWSRSDGSKQIVQAASKRLSGDWSAADDLSQAGQNANSAALAVNAAGDVAAVWSRSNGTNAIVQASGTHFDITAPTTSDDVPAGSANKPVEVTLTPADAGGPAGLVTRYRIVAADGTPGPEQTYDPNHKPTLADGEKIRYFSVDKDGNAEAEHTSAAAKVVAAASNADSSGTNGNGATGANTADSSNPADALPAGLVTPGLPTGPGSGSVGNDGDVQLPVSCPALAIGTCTGTVRLVVTLPDGTKVVIGAVNFSVEPGETSSMTVPLSAAGRRLLAEHGGQQIGVHAIATSTDASGATDEHDLGILGLQVKPRPAPQAVRQHSLLVHGAHGLVLRTAGRVTPARGLVAASACSGGGVFLIVRQHGQTLLSHVFVLNADCTFGGTNTIRPKAVGRLVVRAKFLGTMALRPRKSRTQEIG